MMGDLDRGGVVVVDAVELGVVLDIAIPVVHVASRACSQPKKLFGDGVVDLLAVGDLEDLRLALLVKAKASGMYLS